MPRSGISHNLMATTLAPVDAREVVRCDSCSLVQFRTQSGFCRRCHASLDPEEPEAILLPPTPAEIAEPTDAKPQFQVALAIRSLRQRNGISQRQLAQRMGVPRTYVSKIENEKATPTLSSLERIAEALEVTVPDLLSGGTRDRNRDLRELAADPFISELIGYLGKLNGMQWQSVLAQVRDMSIHTRRSA
jgi:transcriptional regulator with XRE-family HTH domain